jgi:hypothetical protein
MTTLKKILLILVILKTFSPAVLKAQSADDVVDAALQGALEAATKDVLRKFVKDQINSVVASTLASEAAKRASESSASSAGETFASTIDLALAVNDFIHAKNDKEKFYASARGTVAVVTIAAPPVGVILGAVLTVASVGEALLGAASIEEMLRLETLINEHYAVINNVRLSYSEADKAMLISLLTMSMAARTELVGATKKIKSVCRTDVTTPARLRECIGFAVLAINAMKAQVRLADGILNTPLYIIDRQQFFTEKKIDAGNYSKRILNLNAEIASSEYALEKSLTRLSSNLFSTAMKNAEIKGRFNLAETFFNHCFTESLNLIQKATLLSHFDGKVPSTFGSTFSRMNQDHLSSEVKFFKTQPCNNSDRKNPLYPNLIENLKTLDAILKRPEINL